MRASPSNITPSLSETAILYCVPIAQAIRYSEKTCSYLLLENMAKKCFLCGSDKEIIDFNDEAFENCILKLAFRKKKNFKYNFVELSSTSVQFVGYHTTCYKKVTVLSHFYEELLCKRRRRELFKKN